jgi:16S rRNA processing protein RimM
MAEENPKYLVVGEILKPWGYSGEVKVKIVSDYPTRLVKHKTVYLGESARAFQVERARLHSGYALFKFVGYDTEQSVAKLRGEILQIAADDAAKLKKGQYYHYQVVGLNVVKTSGEPLGVVEEILETGANDVYLVRTPEGKELLLPAIKSVVKKIDPESHQMVVELLPGLSD